MGEISFRGKQNTKENWHISVYRVIQNECYSFGGVVWRCIGKIKNQYKKIFIEIRDICIKWITRRATMIFKVICLTNISYMPVDSE